MDAGSGTTSRGFLGLSAAGQRTAIHQREVEGQRHGKQRRDQRLQTGRCRREQVQPGTRHISEGVEERPRSIAGKLGTLLVGRVVVPPHGDRRTGGIAPRAAGRFVVAVITSREKLVAEISTVPLIGPCRSTTDRIDDRRRSTLQHVEPTGCGGDRLLLERARDVQTAEVGVAQVQVSENGIKVRNERCLPRCRVRPARYQRHSNSCRRWLRTAARPHRRSRRSRTSEPPQC